MMNGSPNESFSLGPNPWRIALALIFFLILLSGFLWIAIYRMPLFSSHRDTNRQLSQEISSGESPENGLFYQSIGGAPYFDPPAGYDSPSLEAELNALSGAPRADPGEPNAKKTTLEKERLPEAYTIEIAALTDKEAAEKMVESLKQQGIQAFYTPLLSHNFVIYRVRVGIFLSQQAAAKTLGSIKKHLKNKAIVSALR